jgi:energy-coupling factor transport system permease protein
MMGQEIYLEKKTFFHRLDPRTKLFTLLTFFVIILYFEDPLWIAPMSALVLAHGLASGSLGNLCPLRYILFVLAVSSIIMWNLFAHGKTPLFWIIERESLSYSAGRMLIILSLVVEGVIFLSTTRYEEFTLGLIRLGLPYRVGFAVSTAFRMVPMIVASAHAVAQAQRSRGLDLDSGNIVKRVRKYLPLLVPVFLSMIRSTNTFVMALESRGFAARKRRTFYLVIGFKKGDALCLVFLALLFTVATYFRMVGCGQIPGLQRF